MSQTLCLDEYRTYSFRAECVGDVIAFQKEAKAKRTPFLINSIFGDEEFPDVEVEIISPATMEELLGVLKNIEDTHVIAETLANLPAGENDFVRRRWSAESYFKSRKDQLIFILIYLDGKQRCELLDIKEEHYSDTNLAHTWYNKLVNELNGPGNAGPGPKSIALDNLSEIFNVMIRRTL